MAGYLKYFDFLNLELLQIVLLLPVYSLVASYEFRSAFTKKYLAVRACIANFAST